MKRLSNPEKLVLLKLGVIEWAGELRGIRLTKAGERLLNRLRRKQNGRTRV